MNLRELRVEEGARRARCQYGLGQVSVILREPTGQCAHMLVGTAGSHLYLPVMMEKTPLVEGSWLCRVLKNAGFYLTFRNPPLVQVELIIWIFGLCFGVWGFGVSFEPNSSE